MWPRLASQALACVLLLLLVAGQARATYWIDSVDGYGSLPACAEPPLSSVVRDMVSGCGDEGKATSYSCFCTQSSSEFGSIIATAVAKKCNGTGAQVESATSVFHAYCELGSGDSATVATTMATTTSSSLRPTITSNNKEAAETGVSAESSIESSETLSTGSKIAIGICVPTAVLALAGIAFFLLRRRHRNEVLPSQVVPDHVEEINVQFPHKPAEGNDVAPQEYERAELHGVAVGQPVVKHELE